MRARTMSCVGLALLAVAASAAGSALAAEASGTALAVRQSASATGEGGQRVLQVSGPVYSGDRIVTGARGQAQIQFVDQTKLVVGPNSSLLIDQFVFAANNTADKVSINAVKGAFRFITGVSPKKAYAIKTPTATIGVRGTRFDVSVIDGITNFALYQGGARVCNNEHQCVELEGTCRVAIIPAHNTIQRLSPGAATSYFLASNFPYARSQDRLLPDFRVDTSGCGSIGGLPEPSHSSGGPPPAPPSPPDGNSEEE